MSSLTSAWRLWAHGDCAERLLAYHSLAVPECPSEPVLGDAPGTLDRRALWDIATRRSCPPRTPLSGNRVRLTWRSDRAGLVSASGRNAGVQRPEPPVRSGHST
jgi:hypothetical protein